MNNKTAVGFLGENDLTDILIGLVTTGKLTYFVCVI